jgi:hypothetical protein
MRTEWINNMKNKKIDKQIRNSNKKKKIKNNHKTHLIKIDIKYK